MLPGFSFLLGLGSLLLSACLPPASKPGNSKEDWDRYYMKEQLKKWDNEPVVEGYSPKIHLYAPVDYPPAAEAAKHINRSQWKKDDNSPLGWDDLARYYKTSMANVRCEYFRWRCEKEGVYFYFPGVMEYCTSFGPRCQQKMG